MNATVTFIIPSSKYQGFCFTASEILHELDLACVAATSVKETNKGGEIKLTFELNATARPQDTETRDERKDWWNATIIDHCTIQNFNLNAQ